MPTEQTFDATSLLTARFRSLAPNPISSTMIKAGALRRAGHSVVDFSVGEPDFPTPENVQDAGVKAIRNGQTRYTPTDGTPEIKRAVQEKFRRENGIDYKIEEVTVGTGAKQILFNAFAATLEPGDEVIVPAPYWTTYPELVIICGGTPVYVPCNRESGFKLQPDQLRKALTPKTKWLILNFPSNPTGGTYSAEELRNLAKIMLEHPRAMIMADEMYEHLVYDHPFISLVNAAPETRSRTLTVNGASKTYSMTGWRIGYGGGPAGLIRAMMILQSHATSNPCSISQAAAVEALNGPQDYIEVRRAEFQKRRDLIVAMLNQTNGLSCDRPGGAFYVFVDCSRVLGRKTPTGITIKTDLDFTTYLLDQEHVASVHGAAFGLSPFFRISYATSEEQIMEGCRRIQRACAALQ